MLPRVASLMCQPLVQVSSAEIAIEKAEAETALAEAIPALEEAALALQELKKDDITEIRSFAKPHILVQKVSWRAIRCPVISKPVVGYATSAAGTFSQPHYCNQVAQDDDEGL